MPKQATTPAAWEETFFATLAETGQVAKACRVAGISNVLVYRKRLEDERFSRAWAEALGVAVMTLEDEAVRRGRDGYEEPVFYQGAQVGVIRRYSDTMLIFLLKSHKPSVYNPPNIIGGTGKDGSIQTNTTVRVVYVDSLDKPPTD